jgi:hypothetical protein
MSNENSSQSAETRTETQENVVENKPDEKLEKSEEEIQPETKSDLDEIKKAQEKSDQEKIDGLREKINGGNMDWKEFWKKEGFSMPSRKEVFPNGEDHDMPAEQIVESLNAFLKKRNLTYDNYTGINAEEFPEMVDEDIRKLCVKLNSLPFLRTREGCSGHEFYRSTGEFYKSGYSEPYLLFYINKNNPEAELFSKRLQEEFQEFKKSDLPGIENIALDFHDEATETENVGLYWNKMFIVPTKEWCKKNGRKYVERPKELGFFEQWCQHNGYEYSDDEKSPSRKKWEKVKKKYWKEMGKFEKEYAKYFRSEEAKKLRDEFFKTFERAIPKESEAENYKKENEVNWEEVDEVIDESYREVAKERDGNEKEAFYSPWCELVVKSAILKFDAKNIKAEIVRYGGWDVLSHEFLILELEGKKWIIDPTWQQFLDNPDFSKPKILKSEIENVDNILESLNVPKDKRHIWKNALKIREK